MRLLQAGLLLLGAVAAQAPGPRFVREIPWAGRGEWIATDTHIHTRFSDGTSSLEKVVAKAIEYGCQAMAITDHGDKTLRAASSEYEAAITAARIRHPEVPILAGLEWNVPPSAGLEHATVLAPPGSREWTTLAEFKRRFDDYHRDDHDSLDAREALTWLAANGHDSGLPPVVIYNHPSRKAESSLAHLKAVLSWRATNELLVGIEGGPGHQASQAGGYVLKEKTVDRWDPAVARVGDLWDVLLQAGLDVSGAYASSDFHDENSGGDYWPCQFSETWLYVPERSAAGVLKALRAGAMFGVHGRIVRGVEFTLEAPGLRRPAIAGESIEVPAGTRVTVSMRFDVPRTDWQGRDNRIDQIELIGVEAGKATVIVTGTPRATGAALEHTLSVPGAGIVVRARGRRALAGEDDLVFYTNPIRVTAGK